MPVAARCRMPTSSAGGAGVEGAMAGIEVSRSMCGTTSRGACGCAAGAVGDRDERRPERLELGDGPVSSR